MKISIDDIEILTISEDDKKILAYAISEKELLNDIKERIISLIGSKIGGALEDLKREWVKGGNLSSLGFISIPIDDKQLAQFIFAQPSYKDRKQKDDSKVINLVDENNI